MKHRNRKKTDFSIPLTSENSLTLKNYKEPLKKIPENEGFGYYGAILVTQDGKGIQCHICGKVYQHLGLHIYQTHKIKPKEYREKFNLASTTALISESIRSLEEFVETTQTQRFKHLIFQTFGSWNEAISMLKLTPKLHKNNTNFVRYNDEQLLEYLRNYHEEYGQAPTATDFKRSFLPPSAVYKRHFGSMEKARELAGLDAKLPNWRKRAKYITSH